MKRMQTPTISTCVSGWLALALLLSGCAPPSLELPPVDSDGLVPVIPIRGVAPCIHPMPRQVGFDEPTALGISAQQAFSHLNGSCVAPFKWTPEAHADAEDTDVSVQVVLDRASAVEVTHAASDFCTNEITIQ